MNFRTGVAAAAFLLTVLSTGCSAGDQSVDGPAEVYGSGGVSTVAPVKLQKFDASSTSGQPEARSFVASAASEFWLPAAVEVVATGVSGSTGVYLRVNASVTELADALASNQPSGVTYEAVQPVASDGHPAVGFTASVGVDDQRWSLTVSEVPKGAQTESLLLLAKDAD